jgi:precorrin-6Y C5,15-methyltransferase (decarboxylating)
MTADIIGIGLDGAAGLAKPLQDKIARASLLVGSDRHLSYFPDYEGETLTLNDFKGAIAHIKQRLESNLSEPIVILTSGDPLFFGFGRLLLQKLPSDWLNFYPQLSSIQLAFNRVKVPWQDAKCISAHGRSLDELTQALKKGIDKIAVLTDKTNSPSAIADLLNDLDLPSNYELWVCENLGGSDERVGKYNRIEIRDRTFAPLNVVILLRQNSTDKEDLNLDNLPLFGIPDRAFLSFPDRPGLITKREVRLLVLGELALQPDRTVWDIGAGTGSVSIEIARLFPSNRIYAIEKTAIGTNLIEKNCKRFCVKNICAIGDRAPNCLHDLPNPDRVFIGGSGGQIEDILQRCGNQLTSNGVIVLALATLEHLNRAMNWLQAEHWTYRLLQVQLSRSVAIGSLTRWSPLNPVAIVTATKN